VESQTGFLISRQWRDTQQGLVLRYWCHTINGPLLVEQTNQEGVFFIEAPFLNKALRLSHKLLHRHRPLALKSFSQHAVSAFYFTSQRNLRNAATLLKDNNIEPLEADVRTVDRYLMERFITSALSVTVDEANRKDQYLAVQNAKLKPTKFNPQFKVISFDIETNYKTNQVLSIAVYGKDALNSQNEPSIENEPSIQNVFMLGDAVNSKAIEHTTFYDDEKRLLIAFIDWLHSYNPDILIGWNCINFDLRILGQACKRLGLDFHIGRNHEAIEWRTSPNNEHHYFVLVPGRAVLDGIDTLKSATYSFESFSLESVSRAVLNKGKLIHDPDDRGEEILRQFHEDKPALAKYNIEDCKLVWEIFEATDLIQFAIERANLTGLALDKIGGSVAAFENQYLPRLHRQGYVAPNLPVNPQGVGSPGGYVMSSQPGFYDHVLVLDFKSLYPSIIRSFLVDPYGLAEGDRLITDQSPENETDTENTSKAKSTAKHYDPALFSKGKRGAFFKRQDSILPGLIEHLWQARDRAKLANKPALSQAIKIIMNSFYGVMGTPGCRFFDARLPSSITLRGHEIMTQTSELIEQRGYQVIYGDTDSIFVWLNQKSVDSQQADQIGNQLAEEITLWWKQHLQQEYQLTSALELEYENHYSRFLMPTIRGSERGSKKRYAGMVTHTGFSFQNPQPDTYQLIFKGLETVRTDWTHLAREFQKELYKRIFLNQAFKPYIHQVVHDLKAGKYDDKLVYRKRLRRKLQEYQRNVPPHVQAARKADAWLETQGKITRYQNGGWIEYCYTLNGPEPLECLSSPLDYDLYLERQIAPIVDAIVSFLGTSFTEITSGQMTLL